MKTNDEAKIGEVRKREKVADFQWKDDFRYVMDNPRGRRVIYKIIFNLAGVERSSFNPSGSVTYFNEGMREVGLELMRQLQNLHPELYLRMLEEAFKDAAEVNLRRQKREENDE
jgi:hypothetical protein